MNRLAELLAFQAKSPAVTCSDGEGAQRARRLDAQEVDPPQRSGARPCELVVDVRLEGGAEAASPCAQDRVDLIEAREVGLHAIEEERVERLAGEVEGRSHGVSARLRRLDGRGTSARQRGDDNEARGSQVDRR